jgi:thiol-disulfide isomerase/thioredoxin
MKSKKYFMGGLILSPLLLGFIWLLESKQPSEFESLGDKTQPQKSLASIDFVPSPTRKQVSDQVFFQLSVTDEQQKTTKKLSEYTGKPIILHFWATWCGACVEEIPELDKFAQQFKDTAHIVVVASDQTQGKAVREFYQKHNIHNISLCIDDQGKLAKDLEVKALPTTVFISSSGKEMGKVVGPIDWIGEPGKIVSIHLTKKQTS